MKWELASNDAVEGTHLQGYVRVGYDKLVETFGKPNVQTDEYKVDAEWALKFEDGRVATIYNYKDGKNYNGENGLPVEQIVDWHIGGKYSVVVNRVAEILGTNSFRLGY